MVLETWIGPCIINVLAIFHFGSRDMKHQGSLPRYRVFVKITPGANSKRLP